ncbi:alpha/beta-Hydrolases superfamily protein [Actinidia rufa]|uniref:Alpha/beta-Hydrolases superfamily protein n=1 Tax=Actinidia rufa TaxID=165716 RepID=A0A7J0D9W9_9ERIC|nr:alpha/beta-Hydrolases superfamily protein [Actinidia rufa]
MACKEDFCKDYLVLNPEHASLLDLVRILFLSDLGERRFVESSEVNNLGGLKRRWLIFMSVLVQKVLIYLRKPMARMGYVLEMWLNLLASNGGFGLLLLNLLKGSMVKPDKSLATFTSVVGNLDKRLELDKSINTGDSRYGASLSIMASTLSYENEAFVQNVVTDHWKMEFLGLFNFWNDYQEQLSTQAIMFKDTTSNPNLIVVAFRGTEPFNTDQWRTDVDFSWYELQGVGRIHGGFMKALGLQKKTGWPKEIVQGLGREYAYYTIRQKLRDELNKNEKAKFILTGHSLGGALAILFVAVLGLHEEAWLLKRLDGVYTFGQPRVGDKKFGEFMKEKLRVYGVKYLRSFIIPCTEGPDYKEGWFLRLMRVLGLAIPGLSAHFPPDYINATRLGSLPSQILVQDLTQQRCKHD